MILLPGRHVLRRVENPHVPFVLEWASVSSGTPSSLKVWVGDELVEHVAIGPSTPHTWWSSNPLLSERQAPSPGDRVVIEVGHDAIFRIESNLERVTP